MAPKRLKPVENYIGNYLKLWDNIDNPRVVESWHAMNTWVTDNIPMAGGAYRQLIVDLYRNDRLMQGSLAIRGNVVDLKQLRANLLTVIAEGDHITPPCQSEAIRFEGWQYRHRGIPRPRRSYRNHGRKRRTQTDLAPY